MSSLKDYRRGFMDGFRSAIAMSPKEPEGGWDFAEGERQAMGQAKEYTKYRKAGKNPKRKVRQTPKQKLLTQMTKKKWDKYKKGRGKKTYVEIRAEVSRSLKYKKAVKRL